MLNGGITWDCGYNPVLWSHYNLDLSYDAADTGTSLGTGFPLSWSVLGVGGTTVDPTITNSPGVSSGFAAPYWEAEIGLFSISVGPGSTSNWNYLIRLKFGDLAGTIVPPFAMAFKFELLVAYKTQASGALGSNGTTNDLGFLLENLTTATTVSKTYGDLNSANLSTIVLVQPGEEFTIQPVGAGGAGYNPTAISLNVTQVSFPPYYGAL
jgi:hypothetical protein